MAYNEDSNDNGNSWPFMTAWLILAFSKTNQERGKSIVAFLQNPNRKVFH